MKRIPKLALTLRGLTRGAILASLFLAPALGVAAADSPPADKTDSKPDSDKKTEAGEADKKADAKTDADKADADTKSDDKKEEKEKEYRNWFDIAVGGTIVDKDNAAFQRRYGLPSGAFGGVQDFHYEEDIGKKGIFKVDGHGLFDNHDYSVKFDVEHPDIGYIRSGYEEFRTYYDRSGGYFPTTGTWVSPVTDDVAVDRGLFFFEAGLTLPKKPNVTFRYEHEFRNGEKDSTSWGDVTIPGFGVRKIAPGFWDLDETRDSFALDAKHTLGGTTFGLGLRYEFTSDDNARDIIRNPGEATARYGTDREKVTSDLFNVHAFSETQFNDKLLFTSGYSYTTLNSDLSGYRVYGSTFDPVFAQRLPVPDTFENLNGGSDLQQHVGNVNLMWQLSDALVLIPSLRIDKEDNHNDSFYDSPAAPYSGAPYQAVSDHGLLDVTERLDLRYTGLTNWVFYTRGEWLQGSGDLHDRWDNIGTGANLVTQSTDESRYWQTYTVGANWYPLRKLNFGAEYYYKERSNDYNHQTDSTLNSLVSIPTSVYPAFLTAQGFATHDANFRATWRALPNLTLVARYDFQFSTIDTKPDSLSGLGQIQTSEMTSHIVGGTASWTPLPRLYLQAGINLVWDQTETPASSVTPAVQDAKNNYWTVNSALGYALDDKTDLQLQYLYYRASDYQNNALFGMPYGADSQEHGITTTLTRRISERIRVSLKYGFYDGEDNTSGGHNNYRAHLIYSSLHYRF